MEYYCHVWAGIPSFYLDMLDKLWKRVFRTVGPSLSVSHKPLSHCRNVVILSLFHNYYLVDVHLNLLNWFQFFVLGGCPLVVLRLLFLII